MSKTILIVESDPTVVESVSSHLVDRGVTLEHTSDGKGCVDFVRRKRPDAVILAVELPAGQNGYLVCREIKKDDDLKSTPVVIIGNPEKFGDHKKLRTHADEYVAKPLNLADLMSRIDPLIGGFPQAPSESASDAESGEETLSLSDLVEVEETAEEISVDTDAPVDSDPDLALLDNVLGDGGAPSAGEELALEASSDIEEPVEFEDAEVSPSEQGAQSTEDALDAMGIDDSAQADSEADDVLSALDGPAAESEEVPLEETAELAPAATDDSVLSAEPHAVDTTLSENAPGEEPPLPEPVPLRTGASADAAEIRSLRARSAEAQDALERSEARVSELEDRVNTLESELAGKTAEVEASRQGGMKGDKDYFALREAANKKDKDILKLKNELNEKEQAELEMREREVQLEQKMSEQSAEMGRKDAQLKALTTRADALLAEKKRAEGQAHSARDESRAATERAQIAEDSSREATARAEKAESELTGEREGRSKAENELATVRADFSDSSTRIQTLERELEESRAQLMEQTTAFAEEASNLRSRVAELEAQLVKHEDRVAKLYGRIKDDEKLRDRVKKALGIASQLLDEPPAGLPDDVDSETPGNEPRAA